MHSRRPGVRRRNVRSPVVVPPTARQSRSRSRLALSREQCTAPGFFRPLWSQRILDETKYAILRVHPQLDEPRVNARIAAMTGAFDDALVVGWEQTCAGLDLPDPDDRHVLAAAIKGAAQFLVTFNIKDFPDDCLTTTDIEVVHPDEFLLDQLDLHPGLAVQPMRSACSR